MVEETLVPRDTGTPFILILLVLLLGGSLSPAETTHAVSASPWLPVGTEGQRSAGPWAAQGLESPQAVCRGSQQNLLWGFVGLEAVGLKVFCLV